MIWKGNECHAWHRIEHTLHFLDGRSPADAVELDFSHPLIDPFYEPEIRKNFYRRQPEWLAKIHATVWDHYKEKLFELFDLRRPDLWERYCQFLKEFVSTQAFVKGRATSLYKTSDG